MEFIFDDNIARKTGEPSLLAVEAAKTRLAAKIAKDSCLFNVTKVLDFDQKKAVLDFELLKNIIHLDNVAKRNDSRIYEFCHMVGRALAVVHDRLVLPDEMKHNLPCEWMGSPKENVFIHGDLVGCNICIDDSSGQVVIVDWSAAPLLGRTATYGSMYYDIIWFIIHTFYNAPKRCLFNWDAPGMINAFLAGYAEYHPEVFQRLSQGFIPLMRRYYRKSVWYLTLSKRKSLCKKLIFFLHQFVIYPRFAFFARKTQINRLAKKNISSN